MPAMKPLAVAACASVALVLTGCGGGIALTPAPMLPELCATTTTTTTGMQSWRGYSCHSATKLRSRVMAADRKGFAVDDPTLATCPEQLVAHWPHCPAEERVSSLRLFSSWKKWWNQEDRDKAWHNLRFFLDNNRAKVLLGLDLLCDETNDDWEWKQTFQLSQLLGPDRVMGIAFGNEMDNKPQCRPSFESGAFFRQMKAWVDILNDFGFRGVPVTVVWSMGVLGKTNDPAVDPFKPALEPFLRRAHEEWGKRFVWTFNPYPLWDDHIIPLSRKHCQQMIDIATGPYTRNVMGRCRGRISNFTNGSDSLMWTGESGWSAPFVQAQQYIRKFCPDWASEETLFKFYESMMAWDLSVPNDEITGKPIRGVDHFFFFTMRDFNRESFGLIRECCATKCKVQRPVELRRNTTPCTPGSGFLCSTE